MAEAAAGAGLQDGAAVRLRVSDKLLYGIGATASGVKARGLSAFMMLFYNQVVGLPAAWVGAAIMIALVFDAIVDPLVGQVSDHLRTPWGRRHPFMYASALPLALALFLLWAPPGSWSREAVFVYMIVISLTVRFLDTFFELPHTALLAELTRDYDQRTTLVAFRAFFRIAGGHLMTMITYKFFLQPNAEYPVGVLNREGYAQYGFCAALLVFFTILVSSLGTHRFIPQLHQPAKRTVSLSGMGREVVHTLRNPSFAILLASGTLLSVATGLKGALELYFEAYFWEFTPDQLVYITGGGIVASALGVTLAPIVSRKLGKKRGALIVWTISLALASAPIALRLAGVMPPNGSDALLYIMIGESVFQGTAALTTGILLSSMLADVVEDSEVRTGRRSEGLLFSADSLLKKMVSGLGVFTSGILLTVVGFPQGARPGAVDPKVIHDMAALYLPVVVMLYLAAIATLLAFRLDKQTHEENLRKLASNPKAV
ncbi:MAG TPA: MFS transporter [Phenylobacterium sp.]|uniref:MFS transporter n=1 Tax=Phenylobacterium sp. TaxID=1871053 RepID=UPI002F9298C7